MTLRPLTAITTITVGLLAFSPTRPLHSQEPAPAAGQQPPPQNPPAEQRMINASADPLLAPFRFRSIGPASMGGRIDDIAVAESDPSIIYLGYAVGGVFKSENNGTTFEPVFDELRRRRRSATSPFIRPTRTSSTSAPARRTTGRPRRSATASTRPPTAARPSEHRPARDADHRAHRHRPEESGDRVRRSARTPVRTEQGARRLQDDRRRQDLDTWSSSSTRTPASPTSRSTRSNTQHPLRGELSAPPHRLLLQRRRPRQRAVEDDRRAARRWTKLTAAASRQAPTGASRSTSRARTRTSSTRRSKPVRPGSR